LIGKLEQRILEVLLSYYHRPLSIHQIAKVLNTSYPAVHAKTRELIKQEFIKEEKIGNAAICKLNFENDLLRNVLAHISLIKRNKYCNQHTELQELCNSFSHGFNAFSLSTIFFYDKIVYICLSNPFEETLIHSLVPKTTKNVNVKFIAAKDLRLLSSDMVANAVILYNPEYYYTSILQNKGGSS
jgi:hypothetical protein